MFSHKSNSSVYSRRAGSAGRRNTTFMIWLRKDRPRQVTSAIAMLSLLGSQWLTPCLGLMATVQAAPPTAAELAEKRAAASKPPAWYLAEKRKEETRVAAMDRGMKVLLAQAPSPKQGAAAKQAQPSKPAGISNKITPKPDVVSHATPVLAPNSAKTWRGDSWGEVQSQGGAHILRQSLPGDVKPSAPLYQPEPRISMRKLDLTKIPTEDELRTGGGCCGTMQPAAPADPYGYARRVNQILADQGFDGGLQTPKAGLNVGAQAVLTEAQTAVKKAQAENLEFGQAVQTWNDAHFAQAAGLFQKYVEKYPKSPWTPEALIHLADNAKFHTRPAEAEAIYKQVVDATSDQFGEMSYELHWKAYQHWADMYLRESRWSEAVPMLANIAQNDKYWRRQTWAESQLRDLYLLTKDKKVQRAMRDCGPRALAVVLDLLKKPAAASKLGDVAAQNINGSSLADLQKLAAKYGVSMAGFVAKDRAHPIAALKGAQLPVIIHYAYAVGQRPGTPLKPENSTSSVGVGGHFVVLTKIDEAGHRFMVQNPQDHTSGWLTEDQLAREWSGKGLVLAPAGKKVPARLALLSGQEMGQVRGGCNIVRPNRLGCDHANTGVKGSCSAGGDDPAAPPPPVSPGGGGDGDGHGGPPVLLTSARESASYGEPSISVNNFSHNIFIKDTPLWVKPAVGPPVEITMSYNSQDGSNYDGTFGHKWSFNYGSHIAEDPSGGRVLVMPDGKEDVYATAGTETVGEGEDAVVVQDYTAQRGNKNVLTSTDAHHYTLTSPEGDKVTYGKPTTDSDQLVMLSQQDRWGNALTFHYSTITGSDGPIVVMDSITDADGGVTTLTYNSCGHLVAVTDPHERAATFTYDTCENLVQAVDMEGHAFQYTYDSHVNITQLNTALGPWTFDYEVLKSSDGLIDFSRVSIWNPMQDKPEHFILRGGPQYAGVYSEGFHHIDHRGNDMVSQFVPVYGSGGYYEPKVSEIDEPSGNQLSFDYGDNTNFNPTRILTHGPNGNDVWANLTYNSHGLPHTISISGVDPGTEEILSRTTTVNYVANDVDVSSIVNAKGQTVSTVNSYNSYHQPTSVTDGLGHESEMTYTAWGSPDTITRHEGTTSRITTFHYNSDHRLTSVDRDGITLGSCTYDALGRLETVTSIDGIARTFSFNNLDQATRVTYADGTYQETQYVCCGMPGAIRDRAGRMTYYDYDPLKRLIRVQDASGNTVQLDYDVDGNRVRMLDAKGNVTRWNYDGANRVIQKTYADNRGEAYSYDSQSGLLASSTNSRGQTISYSYGAFGELKEVDYPNDPDVTFGRDELGRLTSMTDGLGTTTWSYNVLNQVISTHGPWSNDTLTLTYDDLNRRSGLSIERGASTGTPDTTAYAYDGLGRLDSLIAAVGGSSIGSWDYNYSSTTKRLTQVVAPNGTKANYSYDYGTSGRGELTQVENITSANDLISRYTYGYDPGHEGMRVSQSKEVAGDTTQTVNYAYDRSNQLTGEISTETTPSLSQSYAYDSMGNRTGAQNHSGGGNTSVAYTSNALNQLTGSSVSNGGTLVSQTTYGYDADGNTTAAATGAGGATYTYDDSDRLTCVVIKDATSGVNLTKSCFAYDGLSRKKIDTEYTWDTLNLVWNQTGEKRYVYDGMDVVQERDGSNNVTASLVRSGNIGGLLSRTTSDGTFFYHYDGGGNVCQLTDGTGATVGKYVYDAFGNASVSGIQGQANPWRYSTKELNKSANFYFFGVRFYSPEVGKWLNRDPVRELGGINLYQFEMSDPIDVSDSYGHFGVVGMAIGAGISGLLGAITGGLESGTTGAIIGGIAGIIGGAVGGIFDNPMIAGGVSSFIQQLLTEIGRWAFDPCYDHDIVAALKRIGIATVAGLLLGGIVKYMEGVGVSPAVENVEKTLLEKIEEILSVDLEPEIDKEVDVDTLTHSMVGGTGSAGWNGVTSIYTYATNGQFSQCPNRWIR